MVAGLVGAPGFACPLRPANRSLRGSQQPPRSSAHLHQSRRRERRRMSLFVIPCFDRGLEAIFSECVVAAFQHIGRRSQRRDGVPLKERLLEVNIQRSSGLPE